MVIILVIPGALEWRRYQRALKRVQYAITNKRVLIKEGQHLFTANLSLIPGILVRHEYKDIGSIYLQLPAQPRLYRIRNVDEVSQLINGEQPS